MQSDVTASSVVHDNDMLPLVRVGGEPSQRSDGGVTSSVKRIMHNISFGDRIRHNIHFVDRERHNIDFVDEKKKEIDFVQRNKHTIDFVYLFKNIQTVIRL